MAPRKHLKIASRNFVSYPFDVVDRGAGSLQGSQGCQRVSGKEKLFLTFEAELGRETGQLFRVLAESFFPPPRLSWNLS